jgi:hypothetical protein
MKSTLTDYAFAILVVGCVGFLMYTLYSAAGSPEAAEWLARPFSKATMKDVVGIGGILVVLHAIFTRGD